MRRQVRSRWTRLTGIGGTDNRDVKDSWDFDIVMTEHHDGAYLGQTIDDVQQTQHFHLTVVNAAPDLVPQNISVNEGVTQHVDLNAYLTGAEQSGDGGAAPHVQWTILDWNGVPGGEHGGKVVLDKDTGVLTFNLTDDDVGSHAFRVKIEDGNSGSDTAMFWLTVQNTTPVINTTFDPVTITEDAAPATYALTLDFAQKGHWSIRSGPSWASVSTLDPNTGTGQLTLHADNSWDADQANNTVTLVFTDSHGAVSDPVTVPITVSNNDPYFAVSPSDQAHITEASVTWTEDDPNSSFDV